MSVFTLEFPLFPELLAVPMRLGAFIAWRFSHHQPEDHQQWFAAGLVAVNGQTATPEQELVAGQVVSVMMPGHIEAPTDTRWYTLWENEEILAVYKPPLLPVSRTTRNLYNTLIQLVRRQTPWHDAHLLHRLDTETDGVMLLAKNSAADRKWKPQLHRLIERKLYHARVQGQPAWQQLTFEAELSEREGSEIRSQMYVVEAGQRALFRRPKFSCTHFTLLSYQAGVATVACELVTGRKHQIRAHLAHLGHPVIGDKIYAHDGQFYLKRLAQPLGAEDYAVLGAEHHQLTAVQLDLRLAEDQRQSIVL